MGRARLAGMAAFVVLALAPVKAFAAFHLWQIKEVYSNSTGSIQYIELFTTAPGQEFLATHTITANDGTTTRTFTFPTNVAAGTAGKHLLIATPGFANLSGAVQPDFVLPCGPLFDPNAATITINFGSSSDILVFSGSLLPTDGVMSLTDTGSGPQVGTNSPTNYAGAAGLVSLTMGQSDGTVSACNDGLFCNGAETCNAGACSALPACPGQQCIEGTQECVECTLPVHCNDNNPCTDDTCNVSNECEHAFNTGPCDDGLFCNGTDTCSSGQCLHAGDPCGGINCNEGPDTCADCTGASDCEDGQPCTVDTCTSGQCGRADAADGAQCDDDATFCNGVGSCMTGVCGQIEPPCDEANETCAEDSDACEPIMVGADAGTDPNPDIGDGGGCCQANVSLGTLTAPALVLALGALVGRRRRTRPARRR